MAAAATAAAVKGGRRGNDPFKDAGWTRDQLLDDAATDSFVMRHPERQIVVLHSATAATSLLQRLQLDHFFAQDSTIWVAILDKYNEAVQEHDSKLSTLREEENATGSKTWHDRLQVWKPERDASCIGGVSMTGVWLASFCGALCFLLYLSRISDQSLGGVINAAHLATLARKAEEVVLEDWRTNPAANVLKRLLLANSKPSSGDKYQKCYKKCRVALEKLELRWWPPQWANQQGPDQSATTPAAEQRLLPLCIATQRTSERALNEQLNAKVFGQPLAVRHAVNAVWHRLTGVVSPLMPTVIAFAGPSGHGKTYLGTQLTKALFGDDLDVAQEKRVYLYYSVASLTDKSSISSLLGAAQGLNQSEHPGALATFLKHQKDSLTPEHAERNLHWIVFLDEVDRAYPTLLEDLRNWFDQGEVRSGFGESLDGRKGLIILGTNVGAGVTIRRKDGGGERVSTENCLSRPMPLTAESVAESRERVQRALLNDLCHGQAPTFGRIPYLAPFYQFGSDEFEKALHNYLHAKITERLKLLKDVRVPPNLEIRFDASVRAWLLPFYKHQIGFRSLEYQLTTITAECRKLLQSAVFQQRYLSASQNSFVVHARIFERYMRFRSEGTAGEWSDEDLEDPKLLSAPARTQFETADCLQTGAATAAAAGLDTSRVLPIDRAAYPPSSAAAAASPTVQAPSHPQLHNTRMICAAINEIGRRFVGQPSADFQRAVTSHLLDGTDTDEGSAINEHTWKKALSNSQFTTARKPGHGMIYFLKLRVDDVAAPNVQPASTKRKHSSTAGSVQDPNQKAKRSHDS